MSKRHSDALFIQQGACNPSGIARSLVSACKECIDEGVSQREDPAVRLIVHQLAHLCNLYEIESDTMAYSRLMDACEAAKEQGPVKIIDEAGVHPNVLDKAIVEQAAYYGTMVKNTLEHVANMRDTEFAGYHKFRDSNGGEYGSFKVYHLEEEVPTAGEPFKPGWYWQAGQPDMLPDGDAYGPFPTAEGAYLDAIKE